MECRVYDEFTDVDFSPDKSIDYFGTAFWRLMNESCGNYDLTMAALCFLNEVLPQTASVCDIMCGNGRFALGLSSLGYKVTAVDIRNDIISSVRQTVGNNNVIWRVRDVYETAMDGEFDSVIIMTSSLGYYGVEKDRELLKKCYESLNSCGMIILDIPNGDWILTHFLQKDWISIPGAFYLFHYKLRGQTKYTNMKVIYENKREDYYLKSYIYKYSELEGILKDVGFSKIETYTDFCLIPTSNLAGARRIQIVATK